MTYTVRKYSKYTSHVGGNVAHVTRCPVIQTDLAPNRTFSRLIHIDQWQEIWHCRLFTLPIAAYFQPDTYSYF